MKTTLQFFKDMEVCDGAYQTLQRVFNAAGVTEFDYAQGYQLMLGMMDEIEADAAQSADPDHASAAGWLKWCYDLRYRPEAIMYFGDHIAENLFRTADGHLYETHAAATDHRRRVFAKLRQDHAAARVINGVILGADGAETWKVIDPGHTDLSRYDAFVWHDSTTGLNHRTQSSAEAIVFDAAQASILADIEAAEAMAHIQRRMTDESGAFSVWVDVSAAELAQTEG
jgi:hypothetical protein